MTEQLWPTCGAEGPAGAAEELVLHRRDGARLHPIHALGCRHISMAEAAAQTRPEGACHHSQPVGMSAHAKVEQEQPCIWQLGRA